MEKISLKDGLNLFQWMIQETPIRYFGDPILQNPCEPFSLSEITSQETKDLADTMCDVLRKLREKTGFGRGLAANQIGVAKRMIVLWLDQEPTIYINPEIVKLNGKGSYWECCFSSGAFLIGEVERAWTGVFSYYDLEGTLHVTDANEKQTRLFLHEIEHLNGHNCTESYKEKTISFIRGGKEEIFGHEFRKIERE